MDELDGKIIEVLKRDGKLSPAKIADKVKVSERTVYNRIDKLEGDGVIKQYTIFLGGEGAKLRVGFIHPLKYLSSDVSDEDVRKLGLEVGKHQDVVLSARVGDTVFTVWREGKFNPKNMVDGGRVEELDISEVYKSY